MMMIIMMKIMLIMVVVMMVVVSMMMMIIIVLTLVCVSKGYGAGVDWWSCGILLHEMLLASTPFEGIRATVPYLTA